MVMGYWGIKSLWMDKKVDETAARRTVKLAEEGSYMPSSTVYIISNNVT